MKTIFQFPLLGFLLCILSVTSKSQTTLRFLSIPFIGIFALHLTLVWLRQRDKDQTFNSLYWDFCSASVDVIFEASSWINCFQFPLLGFLLCIDCLLAKKHKGRVQLSIPFIGIFALHHWKEFAVNTAILQQLSIPFIGIFALHRSSPRQANTEIGNVLSIPFIGIFALHLIVWWMLSQ